MRVLAVLGTVWCFRKAYASFRWSWSWQAVGLGALTSIVWILLAPTPSEASAGGLSPSELAGVPIVLAVGWWFFRVVGYVIAVPLAEELAFRGYLTRRLISADFHRRASRSVLLAILGGFLGSVWCVSRALLACRLFGRHVVCDSALSPRADHGRRVGTRDGQRIAGDPRGGHGELVSMVLTS